MTKCLVTLSDSSEPPHTSASLTPGTYLLSVYGTTAFLQPESSFDPDDFVEITGKPPFMVWGGRKGSEGWSSNRVDHGDPPEEVEVR